MHRLWLACLALAASAALVACGNDEDNTVPVPGGGGELFSHGTNSGSLRPVQGEDGVFTLTFDDPAPQVTSFTDRPARSAGVEQVSEFVDRWEVRGFADDPPNAALVVDAEPDNADTAVYTIATPSYDRESGAVSYRAERIEGSGIESLPQDEGDPPARFGRAHLFIDPAAAVETHTLSLRSVGSGPSPNDPSELKLDSGFSVVVSSNKEVVNVGSRGGGVEVWPQRLRIAGFTGLSVRISGSPPITGTADISDSAEVTAGIETRPLEPVEDGRFCLGPGCP